MAARKEVSAATSDGAVEPAIETSGLTKRFGDIRAVDGLSFSLEAGGTSASVTERICSNSIATSGNTADLCSNASQSASVAPLGQMTVQSGSPMQQVAPGLNTAGSVHIFQTIDAGDGSSLGALYEGFGDPATVPEPITFVLLGSALAFLGIAGRRLRKD